MNGRNPCDVCDGCKEDCIFLVHTMEFQCTNYACFLNHEGDCLVSAFDNCGAWEKVFE